MRPTSEDSWREFELTGSVQAYLQYRDTEETEKRPEPESDSSDSDLLLKSTVQGRFF